MRDRAESLSVPLIRGLYWNASPGSTGTNDVTSKHHFSQLHACSLAQWNQNSGVTTGGRDWIIKSSFRTTRRLIIQGSYTSDYAVALLLTTGP